MTFKKDLSLCALYVLGGSFSFCTGNIETGILFFALLSSPFQKLYFNFLYQRFWYAIYSDGLLKMGFSGTAEEFQELLESGLPPTEVIETIKRAIHPDFLNEENNELIKANISRAMEYKT